jgi:glycosyltransferase involved in cell wall biosynthesis
MNKPLTLSIVIPAYNEENYLTTCLEAIAVQTEKPDEVIVVDNNSTDKTVAVAKRYPFVTIVSESEQGVLYARTTGFNKANGDILGRIDADTHLPPNWVHQVKQLFGDKSVTSATGPCSYYDMPLEGLFKHFDYLIRLGMSHSKEFSFLWGSNMAIRASAWQMIRSRLCQRRLMYEDIDLALHLTQSGHKPMYTRYMQARVSARRFDDGLKAFYPYAKLYQATYHQHGLDPLAAKLATFILFSVYITFKPLRYLYDPKKMRVSFKKIIRPSRQTPRKNPMDLIND